MALGHDERLLRPGVNFTNRGELKYARAVHLANELRGRIDEWAAAETLLARVHQVDERTVEFRLVLRWEPPIEEWSLILGDALHNLRSMFDNVVWALATLDGAAPKHPKQVTFPVTRDQSDWEQRVRTLESIPTDLLERLRTIQPWATSRPKPAPRQVSVRRRDRDGKNPYHATWPLKKLPAAAPGVDPLPQT